MRIHWAFEVGTPTANNYFVRENRTNQSEMNMKTIKTLTQIVTEAVGEGDAPDYLTGQFNNLNPLGNWTRQDDGSWIRDGLRITISPFAGFELERVQ